MSKPHVAGIRIVAGEGICLLSYGFRHISRSSRFSWVAKKSLGLSTAQVCSYKVVTVQGPTAFKALFVH